jgi:hypothetical protein
MNNAIYGKTIENVLKRQDIKFCCNKKKALNYVKKINFNHETIFTKNLVALHKQLKSRDSRIRNF